MNRGTRRGLFLDRDGILNTLVYYADTNEWESPRTAAELVMIPQALDVLETLQTQGWQCFVVSNQPSYAKGKTSMENLLAIHAELEQQLTARHIAIQEFYYCYHHPNGVIPAYTCRCSCRKPEIGSLLKASQRYQLDLRDCWFIGDQDTDIACGQRAGCHTIQIEYAPSQNKRGSSQPDWRCQQLSDIISILPHA